MNVLCFRNNFFYHRCLALKQIGFLLFLLLGLLYSSSVSARVLVKTNPQPDQIIPNDTLVKVEFLFEKEAEYEILIKSPDSHPVFSTDFPIVEGTVLYHLTGYSREGNVYFKMMFPIRGEYLFEVKVNRTVETHFVSINENPTEYKNLAILMMILFGLGFGGGYLLKKAHKSEKAAARLANHTLFWGYLFLMLYSGQTTGRAHENIPHTNSTVRWSKQTGSYQLIIEYDPTQAFVGKLIPFNIRLLNNQQPDVLPFTTQIQAYHLEDDKMIFDGTFTSKKEEFADASRYEYVLAIQFVDGAPTRVRFQITTSTGVLLEVEEVINVIGIQPPLLVKLKTVAIFVGVIFLGMLTGFLIPQKSFDHETV